MTPTLQSVGAFFLSIKWSVLACLVTLALGLLSMGALGGGLYYLVRFALPTTYPQFEDFHGDWVWPTLIMVGMTWSVGFLGAGTLDFVLAKRRAHAAVRGLAYVLVLWLWALALWMGARAGQ